MTPVLEQRNPYKGAPERGWLRVGLLSASGNLRELPLLADTGNPCAVIVGAQDIALMALIPGLSLNTNFGTLAGGWLRVIIPEIAFDQLVLGYASDAVATAAKASSPDFAGLVGLPLLRMMECGGDADFFCVRPAGNVP